MTWYVVAGFCCGIVTACAFIAGWILEKKRNQKSNQAAINQAANRARRRAEEHASNSNLSDTLDDWPSGKG